VDVVTLPLVRHDTTVEEALEAMNAWRRSGVVVLDQTDDYRLFFAGDLLRARANKIQQCGEAEGGKRLVIVDPPLVQQFSLDLVRPRRSWAQYEQMLDSQQSSFALVGEGNNEVLLVTRHEELEQMLTLTGGYECTGAPRHYFPEPYVTNGAQCPLYPACAVHGQPPSIIRPA
jgi:hypothetical protein